MTLSLGLLGCGTIGTIIAEASTDGTIDAEIVNIFDRNESKIAKVAEMLETDVNRVDDPVDLTNDTELVVEAAGQAAVSDIAINVLSTGTDVMILSVGALADEELRSAIFKTAERTSASVYVPSGSIAGLDAIKAAALTGELDEVILTTTKPPSGLEGAPYIVENQIELDAIVEPDVIFTGSAKKAASAFPSNINVALALSLAGIGPEHTQVRIIADPDEENNVHQIEAKGGLGSIQTKVRNVPSPTNPKTSFLAPVSAIEKIRGLNATIDVGN